MSWTDADVEVVARAAADDRVPPLDVMERLGPNPPEDYLRALGARVVQLTVGREPDYHCPGCGQLSDLVLDQTHAVCCNSADESCSIVVFNPLLPHGGVAGDLMGDPDDQV